jgi:hypothetical protein
MTLSPSLSLQDSPIKELLLTDTIPLSEKQKICPKLTIVSTSLLLADAIDRVHTGQSLSHLFDEARLQSPLCSRSTSALIVSDRFGMLCVFAGTAEVQEAAVLQQLGR